MQLAFRKTSSFWRIAPVMSLRCTRCEKAEPPGGDNWHFSHFPAAAPGHFYCIARASEAQWNPGIPLALTAYHLDVSYFSLNKSHQVLAGVRANRDSRHPL
jgi:hypothetical protein